MENWLPFLWETLKEKLETHHFKSSSLDYICHSTSFSTIAASFFFFFFFFKEKYEFNFLRNNNSGSVGVRQKEQLLRVSIAIVSWLKMSEESGAVEGNREEGGDIDSSSDGSPVPIPEVPMDILEEGREGSDEQEDTEDEEVEVDLKAMADDYAKYLVVDSPKDVSTGLNLPVENRSCLLFFIF